MQFRFSITGDKWPTEVTVEASNWATATARAVKMWRQKDGKGSRTTSLNIRGIKISINEK